MPQRDPRHRLYRRNFGAEPAHDAVPAFLARIRARNSQPSSSVPSWLNWNAATLLLAFFGFVALLWLLSPILAPFLAAAILAYILAPLVERLESKGIPRSLCTGIAVVGLLVAVAMLMLIVLPLFYKEVAQLVELIPGFVEQLKTRLIPWLSERWGIAINIDASSFRQLITDNLGDASGIAKKLFSSVSVGGLAVVGFLINVLLIPVVLFYVLRDWVIILGHVGRLIPRGMYPTVSVVAREIDAVLSEFLRGQVSVMLIMALYYVLGLWLVGLNFALPVGIITGLLVFVPYLGSGIGLLLGTLAAVMQFSADLNSIVLVWVVFGLGQLIEGFLVTPWLVGNRIGLHPLAVMFALLAFGQLFGFFGLLLALPASAAILVGLRHLNTRYQSSNIYRS